MKLYRTVRLLLRIRREKGCIIVITNKNYYKKLIFMYCDRKHLIYKVGNEYSQIVIGEK